MSRSTLSLSRDLDVLQPAPADSEPLPRYLDWRVVLPGLSIFCALYVWWHLGRGWIPGDDGTLGQSAERVMQGQLPHRDFDDVYTGGLAWMNAAAFRLLGTNLWTLRLVLFAFFVAWVPAVFYIASRFIRPIAAAGVVILAVVWSIPNYSAAMPSWYNLFFATFGVAALLRYLEDTRRRWLMIAGLAGGLSFLVKVIGLYYVAGVLLFLVFHAHALAIVTTGAKDDRGGVYAAFVSASLLLFVAALYSIVRRQLHGPEFVQFVLPSVLLAALLARNEWTQPAGPSAARFARLVWLLIPFLAGVVLPVVLFLVPYAHGGALAAFVNGVFVLPMRRVSFVTVNALPLPTMLALLPFGMLLWLARRTEGRLRRREAVLLVFTLALLVRATGGNGALYRTIWSAARSLPPVLVVIGVFLLWRGKATDKLSPLKRAQMMLLLAVTALCSLVQFPYTLSLYFCYIAPLVVLSALAVHSNLAAPQRVVPGLLVAFFTAFAVLRMNTTRIASIGNFYQAQPPMAPLAMERGGIEVPRGDAILYDSLVTMLGARARGGYTWAAPDSPEVYFLSGLKNPTRTLFEVFDDSTNASERVLHALDAHHVTAVVLAMPTSSPPITPEMFTQLVAHYPHSRYVGPFQVRWRE